MFLLGRLKTYLAAAGVVLGAILVAYFRGKRDSVHEYEREADRHLIDSMRTAREVEDEIESLDDVGLGERASKWLRNADSS
jgi:hypothetical protein